MLRAFGYHVAMCCDILDVVKFENVQIFLADLWMLHDIVLVWPGTYNNVAPQHAH